MRAGPLARRRALLLMAAAALGGCGFRLAGTAPMPKSLAVLHLETRDFDNREREALLRRLRRAGVEVSSEPVAGHGRLGVRLLPPREQRLITSASSGKTVNRLSRELEYSLWGADGQLRAGPSRLAVEKDLRLDDDNLLSSAGERQSTIEGLDENLFDRLVRQLQNLQ